MKAVSHRSTKVFGALAVLAAAALAGCAATGGAVTSNLAESRAARPVAQLNVPTGYVCTGGHASRFPAFEQDGRVCRPALSLQAIY
jgi:2-methylaconitate cis-trans-isomerase PrpF